MRKFDPATVRTEWATHVADCPHCAKFESGKPATLAHVCVAGAPLLKGCLELDAAPEVAARRRAERAIAGRHLPKRVSKDVLAQVMRYKGE